MLNVSDDADSGYDAPTSTQSASTLTRSETGADNKTMLQEKAPCSIKGLDTPCPVTKMNLEALNIRYTVSETLSIMTNHPCG